MKQIMTSILLVLFFNAATWAMQSQGREELFIEVRDESGAEFHALPVQDYQEQSAAPRLPVALDNLLSHEKRRRLLQRYSRAQVARVIEILAYRRDPAYVNLARYCVSHPAVVQETARVQEPVLEQEDERKEPEEHRELLEQACMVRCMSELAKKERRWADLQRRSVGRYLWGNCCCFVFIVMQLACLVPAIPLIRERRSLC
jgi:hypothetical protein